LQKQGNPGNRHSSHLTTSTRERLIDVMTQTDLGEVITEMKKTAWYLQILHQIYHM